MANGHGKSEQPIDQELVENYVEQLCGAKTQRAAYDRIFAELKSDKRLKAPDIIAIAHRYNGGGKKPSSKTMALAAISKRFVEIVRFHAKNKVAEKARPW
jgi:hypothetical protein